MSNTPRYSAGFHSERATGILVGCGITNGSDLALALPGRICSLWLLFLTHQPDLETCSSSEQHQSSVPPSLAVLSVEGWLVPGAGSTVGQSCHLPGLPAGQVRRSSCPEGGHLSFLSFCHSRAACSAQVPCACLSHWVMKFLRLGKIKSSQQPVPACSPLNQALKCHIHTF